MQLVIMASREGFRRACQRQAVPLHLPPAERRFALQRIVNMSWLAVPASAVLAVLVCTPFVAIFRKSAPPEYTFAVFLIAFANVFESSTEPVKSVNKALLRYRIAPVSEGLAAVAGATTSMAIIALGRVDLTLFGYSQLACACTNLAVMTLNYMFTHDDDFGAQTAPLALWRRARSLLPARARPLAADEADATYFDAHLLSLSRGYSLQVRETLLPRTRTRPAPPLWY